MPITQALMMVPSGAATVIRINSPIASFAVGRQVTARTLFTADVVIPRV